MPLAEGRKVQANRYVRRIAASRSAFITPRSSNHDWLAWSIHCKTWYELIILKNRGKFGRATWLRVLPLRLQDC